jgi:AraC-like DNA-binding protein
MRAKGHGPGTVLQRSDIDPRRLDDRNYFIDLDDFHLVVENMIALSGDQGIGLDVGLEHQIGDFGILAYASMSGTNQYRNAEEIWNRYGESVGIMTRLTMNRIGKSLLAMDVNVVGGSDRVRRFFVEEMLALHYSIGADWIGRPPVFRGAHFSYAAPSYVHRYEKMLNCPIKFSSAKTRLTLGELQTRITELTPLVAKIRDVFLNKHGQIVKIGDAAQALRMSTRTLSRQLQARGLSYQKVLDGYLAEMATELIHRKPDRAPIKEISGELGFADVNAFRRSFKRWTGMTVQQYRAKKAGRS